MTPRFLSASLRILLALAATVPTLAAGQNQQLRVNLSSSTGGILHGASGWLYGQAEDGIPTQNLIATLKPQVSAQKPPFGLQHSGGDALQTIPSYVSSGGQQMQVYMQDIYATFYPNNGINEYVSRVRTMTQQLYANPNHARFVYVPFNEPDGVVYGSYGRGITNLAGLESDWKTVYQTIRSIDPNAIIAGPNFFNYDSSAYRSFMQYTRDNNVLPDQVTWHELQANFYTGWYTRYNDYRSIESSLGISPRRIVINEYAQSTGELGIPGRLIQYISRFENSKVYGCLAYWVSTGSLDSLVASGLTNQPTGGWWLYKWYAGMSGNTVTVTPPNANALGLAGVAALDTGKKQARIVFGGGSGNTDVVISGLSSSGLGNPVHVTTWAVDSSNTSVSSGPRYVQEANYTASNNQITVTVNGTNATSAYYLIVTPAKSLTTVNNSARYEAEYADTFGSATVPTITASNYSGTGYVSGYSSSGAVTEFDVNAASSGFYNVTLHYTSPSARTLQLYVNGSALQTRNVQATANANTWNDDTVRLFLIAGINRVAYGNSGSNSNGVVLDYLNVASTSGTITTYQASSSANTLGGAAVVQADSSAPGGNNVGYIGQGSANYLQFNNVNVPSAGLYRMIVTYANNELYNGNPSGKDAVFRFAQISVNGGTAQKVYFNSTFDWRVYQPIFVDVNLNAGNNTIRFSNSTTTPNPNLESGYAPNIARIQIAAAQ